MTIHIFKTYLSDSNWYWDIANLEGMSKDTLHATPGISPAISYNFGELTNITRETVKLDADGNIVSSAPSNYHKWSKTKHDWIEDFTELLALNQEQAKLFRYNLINSNVIFLDVEWQVDENSVENIRDTFDEAAYQNYPDTETVEWILADNTVRDTTADELRQLLSIKVQRKNYIFDAYKAWRAGDMLTPFECDLSGFIPAISG